MAFNAFCYSPTDSGGAANVAGKLWGETQDAEYSGKGAFEILSFELGAENTINIGSISGGGGAGKATFKEFTITKKTDTASTQLFNALVTGKHFHDLKIDLRRAGQGHTVSGGVFMSFEFRMVMVQDISWSGSDGDDVCEETVIFQYGSIRIQYQKQLISGAMETTKHEALWNRVSNSAVMDMPTG